MVLSLILTDNHDILTRPVGKQPERYEKGTECMEYQCEECQVVLPKWPGLNRPAPRFCSEDARKRTGRKWQSIVGGASSAGTDRGAGRADLLLGGVLWSVAADYREARTLALITCPVCLREVRPNSRTTRFVR
jgi:hypothetical protein